MTKIGWLGWSTEESTMEGVQAVGREDDEDLTYVIAKGLFPNQDLLGHVQMTLNCKRKTLMHINVRYN